MPTQLPVLPFALGAFAAGAVVLQWQPALPQLTFCAAGAALAAIVGGVLRAIAPPARRNFVAGCARVLGNGCVLWAAGALGFAYAGWRADIRLADALPPEWEGQDIVLIGVIDDLPHVTERGTRFAFAVERIETPRAIVPRRLSLAWYDQGHEVGTIDRVAGLAAGARWRLVVRLKRPHGNVNPHGFDLEAWLLENGLRATGYVRPDGANLLIDAFAGRATDHVQRARSAVRSRILAALPDAPYAGVIVALVIGEQRAIPEVEWRVFNRTGISHLISISGLHVTVFATLAGAIAFALARRSVALTMRIPARKVAAAIGLGAAALYVLLAGAEVPAVRTVLMLAVAALGLWLARPGTACLVWLWALVAVLVWDPWAGLTPGFWLSFGAVGVLLFAGAGRLASAPPCGWLLRIARFLREAVRTQAVVTIALVPGTLALFGQASLVSPLANALAIPVVTFVVVPLALAGIVLPIDSLWQAAHATFAALMIPLALAGRGTRCGLAAACAAALGDRGVARRYCLACGAARCAWTRARSVLARAAARRTPRCAGTGHVSPDRAGCRAGARRRGQDPLARLALRHGASLHRRGGRGRAHHRAVPARGGHPASRRDDRDASG